MYIYIKKIHRYFLRGFSFPFCVSGLRGEGMRGGRWKGGEYLGNLNPFTTHGKKRQEIGSISASTSQFNNDLRPIEIRWRKGS